VAQDVSPAAANAMIAIRLVMMRLSSGTMPMQ